LYPECLRELVCAAERNPAVGLVGCYTTNGRAVMWEGPEYPCPGASGREVCRARLLGGPYVYGTLTSLLLRCDL
jgi:hypothetical protein